MQKLKKAISIRILMMIVMMACVSFVPALAQVNVSGVVKDANDEPMPGVSIKVKGSATVGTVTDLDGAFRLSVPSRNSVLVFSFLGYSNLEQKVVTGKPMNVKMSEDDKLLDEVVVVGYQEVRKRDLTGSVSKANMNDLLSTPIGSFTETLGGRIAGVNVNSGEGMPGTQTNIVIRGNNSLTQDNTPLYVIDGFPIEDPSVGSSVNPSDIASIDILKDASATAIYGARGANGVVIITTKSGSEGKPKVTYDGSVGFQNVSKKMEMMDAYEFVKLQQEIYPSIMSSTYMREDQGKTYTLDDYRNCPQYDWQDMIFRTAAVQNHNVSMNGGSKTVRYNSSLSYYDQDGVVLNSNFERLQGRLGITVNQKKWKVYANVNYSRMVQTGASPSQQSYSGMNNLFYSVWGYRPVTYPGIPLKTLVDNGYDEDVNWNNDYRFNPIMSLNNEYRKRYSTYIQFNGYVQYEFMKGLRLKVSGGYTTENRRYDTFNNSKTRYGGPKSNDKVNAQRYHSERMTWLNENTMTYQANVKRRHYFNALLGFSLQNSDFIDDSFSTIQIPNESLGMAGMSNGQPSTTKSGQSSWSMMSFFGRFNYNFRSKYYATATFRADGSSKFSGKNRFGYFPSGSVAWNFTEERFMKPAKSWLSNGKVRLSWGLTGNNRVGEYDTYGLMEMLKERRGYYVSSGSIPSGVFPLDGSLTRVGMVPTSVPNKDLKWETTEQWNLGFDLGFLNERVNLTVDLYHKVTRDLLLMSTLPMSSGFISAMKNVGKVRNQGLEITINTLNVKSKTFEWHSNFNIAMNKNKVMELSEDQTAMLSTAYFDQKYNSQPSYIAKKGYPMGMMYGYLYEGTYKYDDFNKVGDSYTLKSNVPHFASENNTQPGMPKYKDLNGDGIIDDNDKTMIGRGLPIHTGGFTNDLRYKNVDLSIFFQWSYGNDVLNANRLIFESSNNISRELNQFASYANRWTPENPTSNIPRATSSASNRVFSSRVIEDGSFLRLKTITLGYSLPARMLRKAGIDKVRFYVAAQNLFTISNYSGYDPEVSIRDGALTPGLDFSAYPRSRSFSFGVNLGF